jgi:D-aminopeptidase
VAFSTAEELRVRHGEAVPRSRTLLPTDGLSPLFQAALETTEEAVLNALLRATSVSGMGRSVEAIPLDRVRAALAKYGRPVPQGRAAER